MYYTYDCEFIERGYRHPLTLISIGMVAADGRELYAQCLDWGYGYVLTEEGRWLRENVIPHLEGWDHRHNLPDCSVKPWWLHHEIADLVRDFTNPREHGKIERFIGYYADYDHVLLCQLFGRMADLPKGYPMYTFDLKQEAVRRGIDWLGRLVPHDPQVDGPEHHALSDARWTMRAYRALMVADSS